MAKQLRRVVSYPLAMCAFWLLVSGCQWSASKTTTDTLTVEPVELTIYTYDSLASDYGLLPKVMDQFEAEHTVRMRIVNFPDTGAMLNQLLAEHGAPKADLVIGIDNTDLARYPDLVQHPTAFDYGYVGFIYDTEAIQFTEPISLATLAEDPAYKGKIIIEQPGLSSPGTQLLLWGQTVFGNDANAFWEALDHQVLTVAPDWNTAYYAMFLTGEAPIVLSYLTSPAYHIDQEGNHRYKAVPITDGYLQQTEYAAAVSDNPLVLDFLEYIVSDPVQSQIATTQWMFPISPTATVPTAYTEIMTPSAAQILIPSNTAIAADFDVWLQQWNGIFGQ